MPRCLRCGNTASFGSSSVPAAFPGVTGSVPGLIAVFDEKGSIRHVENRGLDHQRLQQVCQTPEAYFDRCTYCGSSDLIWP
ncbi:hypothetical protein [Calderihabitans maritimus]|uniref:Uncharacterized protein n=1 Tax=Calderihabitans maritimus TaxID=1246530 RepID=A0A1Z5HNX0_9FIRM|nr:hypothetical protein [Calderihabitans maritimus]GAW91011.1 hypothetical protein TherJR_1625 [Calderihabitans maritimus]